MRAEAAGAERPPGLALRGGPLRSAPASMAHLLTSGPPPDEQDFIQAYEEVREKYKGTEPLAPVCPFGRAGPLQVSQPDSRPCPQLLSPTVVPTEPSHSPQVLLTSLAPCSLRGPGKGWMRSTEPPRL